MPIIMVVDTAVEVFVNSMPLVDDTDFKTIETGVAYNAAGMDLVWNFQTPAGVVTQTAVTPTTAGNYDWTHVGDGMYKIEIPASGGASINNNTEGFGWFTGVATGILPWASPIYQFVPANVANSLVTGSDYLKVDIAHINNVTPIGFFRAVDAIAYGTVDTGSTTTVINFTGLTPTAVTNALNGRVLLFPNSTETATLQGQGGVIQSMTTSAITLATALTTAPIAGDIFVIQ